MSDALPETHVTYLGTLYALSDSHNSGLRWRFYMVALLDSASPAAKTYAPLAMSWVVGKDGSGILQGGIGVSVATFGAVNKVDRNLAVNTYNDNKKYFHPRAQQMIEKVSDVLCVSW